MLVLPLLMIKVVWEVFEPNIFNVGVVREGNDVACRGRIQHYNG